MNSKRADNIHASIYLIGILVATVAGYLTAEETKKVSNSVVEPSQNWILLTIGVSHVLLLVIIAYISFDTSTLKVRAGNRIQTAGYLHTLIGFGTALLILGFSRGQIQITSLLTPLGTALVTSLLGWSLGGEIVARGEEEKGGHAIEMAAEQVTVALDKYARTVDCMTLRHEEQLEKSLAAIVEGYKGRDKELEDWQATIRRHSSALDRIFKETEATLQKGAQSLQAGFSEVETTLRLETLSINIASLEAETQEATRRMAEIARSVGKGFNQLRDALELDMQAIQSSAGGLSRSFKTLKEESEEAAVGMRQAKTEASRFVVPTAQALADIERATSSVSKGFSQLETTIKQSSIEINGCIQKLSSNLQDLEKKSKDAASGVIDMKTELEKFVAIASKLSTGFENLEKMSQEIKDTMGQLDQKFGLLSSSVESLKRQSEQAGEEA